MKLNELHTHHTPPEGLCGSGKFTRLMTFTQLFFGISGTQNRKNKKKINQDFFCNRDFKIPHFSLLFLLYSDT